MTRIFTDEQALEQMTIGVGDRVIDLRAWTKYPASHFSARDHADAIQRQKDAERALKQINQAKRPFPKVVTLCGSTRFKATFEQVNFEETMAGNLVISLGVFGHTDMPGYNWDSPEGQQAKQWLDELHKRKIDLCDEILVINVEGYIGSSTRAEIAYATATGKRVRYLEDPVHHQWAHVLEETP